MSYAGSFASSLLRSAILQRGAYKEGRAKGEATKIARTQAQAAATREERELTAEIALRAAQTQAAERSATLADPNSEAVLQRREAIETGGHRQRRAFDAAHPIPGSTNTGPDRATARARSALKARLMTPKPSKYPGGTPAPGMSESEAEAVATDAYGPTTGAPPSQPTTSSVMAGSILRGGGAASATSTSAPGVRTSSQPANDPRLNVPVKSKGNITLPNSSALPTSSNLKEREMSPADLWDKKVDEGMSDAQATAYVHRIKGTRG